MDVDWQAIGAGASSALATVLGKMGFDKVRGNGVGGVKKELADHVKDEAAARVAVMEKLGSIAEDVAFVRGRFKERDEKQ